MKSRSTNTKSIEELINEYEIIGIQQDDSIIADRSSIYNKLYKKRHAIYDEIRSRGLPARLELTRLLAHPNIQVQINAAIDSLAVAPDAAKGVLRQIRASRIGPQCIDAGMILTALDDGTYTPT